MLDIDAKLDSIGNCDDSPVNYRYITFDDVEVAGYKEQGQAKSF
jgi:hypothetical protein